MAVLIPADAVARRALATAGARAVVAAAAVALVVLAATMANAGGVAAGERPPPFTLPDWQGTPRTLDEFRGKVVVIDFWASWCLPCARALPALDALAHEPRRHDLAILAVDIDSATDTADRFVAEHLPAPAVILLRDPGGKLLARFGAAAMPALYVVDRTGVVRSTEAGYAPDRVPAIATTIDALLAAEPMPPTPPGNRVPR